MKNLVFWGWAEADAAQAVQKIRRHEGIRVVDWIADTKAASLTYVDFLYNHPDLGKFDSLPDDPILSDAQVVKFLHMFSREKRSRGINFHEQMNIAKNYFRYFLWKLRKDRVDHILFSLVPIIGCDYLFYLAAQHLGIKTTMCYQSIFSNRFFYCHDLNDFGSFSNIQELPVDHMPPIEWGHKKDLFYMKGNILAEGTRNPWKILLRETLRHGIRKSSKPMRYSGVIENFTQALDFREKYHQHAVGLADMPLTTDYVYFPLHLQPELTTTGLGGDYSDQLDALERLSRLLPSGWKIYAKENPKQNFDQRGREFFRRLATLDNVVYVSKETDTYWLIENSRFVATITGTAGWEALTGGKPCLYFGLAWFKDFPGAISFREGMSVDDVLNRKIERSAQQAAYEKLYRKTRPGIVDGQYIASCNQYTFDGNVKLLTDFLTDEIGLRTHE